MRVKTSTTKLPISLREEIGPGDTNGQDDPNHYRIARHDTRVNRKEARKQDRTARKLKKAEYFLHGNKRPAQDRLEQPRAKKAKYQNASQAGDIKTPTTLSKKAIESVPPPSRPTTPTASSASKPISKSKAYKQVKPQKAENLVITSSQPSRTHAEEEEDRYIRHLEHQLGYSKDFRRKSRVEDEDGLEDLFEWADKFKSSTPQLPVGEDSDDGFSGGDDIFDEDSETYSGGEDGIEDEDDGKWDEEWGGIELETEAVETDESVSAPASAYIPPHLRKAKLDAQQPSEELVKLTRQLKGFLNRMSEPNIASIINGVEEVYRKNSRNDVTSTLTRLIIDGISSHSTLLDSYVVLHGAFVSSLHKLIGIEFAAHFVQETVNSFETHYAAIAKMGSNQAEDHGKQCSNLIVLFAELYNFQVISCVLVFDIIRSLLDGRLTEFDVELLLKILRSSGQQLRQDDPLALKDIVQIVQDKVADEKETASSRIRFMVETLLNLKNNKIKKVSAAQSQGGESMERMKKLLASLSKSRSVMSHEPLKVSLQDLRSVETRGKWWLVGAAWGGDPLVDHRADLEKRVAYQHQSQKEESNLLKLARKQGMNSDIRRSIFVVIMSSEDYVDACDRLSQLRLSEVQQREIVRVLLHCCGNEKSYNPYYALICQHLCMQSHSYKITMQFCLWDFLRDLGETKVGGAELLKSSKDDDDFDIKSISTTRMCNVAKCYAWWIAQDAVSLMILKPVDFTLLKPQTKAFLKEFFSQILISSQLATPLLTDDLSTVALTKNRGPVEKIFLKGSKVDTLAMGMVYFLTETFRPLRGQVDPISKFLSWGVALATETLRTGLDLVQTL